MSAQVYISGLQPSGAGGLTIGNYLGAIQPLLRIQRQEPTAKIYVFIADLHAITIPHSRLKIKLKILELFALYLACGLDPKKIVFFQQSTIPAHTELAHLLLCHSTIGQLQRMTQFKVKAQQQTPNKTQMIPTGLLTYPCLMAADVLLYDADFVVVGHDQQQHVELIRDLALRFNNFYHTTIFKLPRVFPLSGHTRIMSLKDPTRKMSKSDPDPNAYILLSDSAAQISAKISHALTDSENKIAYDPHHKPAVSNLLQIYAHLTDQSVTTAVTALKSLDYRQFKTILTKVITTRLTHIQQRYQQYQRDLPHLSTLLQQQQTTLIKLSNKKLHSIKTLIGLICTVNRL